MILLCIIGFYTVCLFSSLPDESNVSADQEKTFSVVTAMDLLSYIAAHDKSQSL